jgi:glycine oxidase
MASTTDIVVIGGGIIGWATAFELARRGASVRVVDDRAPGMGATQASAGVLAPFIEAREGGPLLELTARALERFDGFVERVTGASGMPVAYERTGTLDVALQESSLHEFSASAAALRSRGIDAELVDGAAVRAAEPHLSSDALGGLLIPAHGYVSAVQLTQALVAAARRAGAEAAGHARAHRIAEVGSDLAVETSADRFTARAVVLAAGSWSSQIEVATSNRRAPVKPIRGQLLELAWQGTPPRRVLWGERCYVVPWRDGTVLVGATVEDAGFDERTTVAGVTDLLDAVCELLPHAWTARFVAARAGLRPATPDELPIVGWSSTLPNLMYATGHYRNGILLSALTAELVAGAMVDRETNSLLEHTRPGRFQL